VLEDQPAWMTAVLEPVVVPSRLPRPHPVLAELHRLERPAVTRSVEARVRRLVHALASAATSRGYVVTAVDASQRSSGRDLGGVLTFDVKGHLVGVDLVQERDRSPHIPTAAELRDKERYSYSRIAYGT
jgi:hypothetical protein